MIHSGGYSYDQIPYPSLSFSQSHPDRLAAIAILLGMKPAPVEHCRVLELGCASGGNLIPMAYGLPDSEFVGIDASARQIEEGKEYIAALGQKNVQLEHLDILDVDAGLGQFDYIIAHGVYSWVPEAVQEQILHIFDQNLAPSGVGYVSYNTFPGWHMLQIVRDMMLYHTRDVADPLERAGRARSFLSFLAEVGPGDSSAYGSFLNTYAKILDQKLGEVTSRGDALLLHDELAEINEPIYFYQFAERAEAHHLQYLAEAEFRTMLVSNFPPEVRDAIDGMATSVVDLEQYLDFLQNRSLRQTLVIHDDIAINRTLSPERMTSLFVASRAKPATPDPDLLTTSVEQFFGNDGAAISLDHPVTKAALVHLAKVWPRVIAFDDLLAAAQQLTGTEAELDAEILGANLLTAYGYSSSLADLHAYAPPIRRDIAAQPLASTVARLQAQSGSRVTNLRHERVSLDDFDRYLLTQLDGNCNRAALVETFMNGPVANGQLTVQEDGASVGDDKVRNLLEAELEQRLGWLAQAALLTDPLLLGERVDEPR